MKKLVLLAAPLLLAGAAGAQPAPRFEHPQMRDLPVFAAGEARRTAEQMRAGTAWGMLGGMSGGYQGVGGPDEGEEMRVYPPCRSRSDDRCRQRR